MSILATIIPALIPAATDGVRAVINRATGGAGSKPKNVAEAIELMKADTERLQVIQQLDLAGTVSPWVANLRALQRPALATWILVAYIASLLGVGDAEASTVEQLAQLAGMVTFYLFGDRTYNAMRSGK